MLRAASSLTTSAGMSAASRRERMSCASAGLKLRKTVTSSMGENRGGLKSSGHGGFNLGEDQHSRAGLDETVHLNVDLLADEVVGVIDHHHRAIVEITDALALVPAFADDLEAEGFARQNRRLHRSGQFVNVDKGNGLEFGDLAEVVVVGEEFGPQRPRQPDEFGVHFGLFRKIGLVEFDFYQGVALSQAAHCQSGPTSATSDAVVRLSHAIA